jgi:hypothetical protein
MWWIIRKVLYVALKHLADFIVKILKRWLGRRGRRRF